MFRPARTFVGVSGLSPLILIGLGTWGLLLAGSFRVIPVLLLGCGIFLGLVVAFDVPYRVRFDERGVSRVCLARTHFMPWDSVMGLTRSKSGRARRQSNLAMGTSRRSRKHAEKAATEKREGSGGLAVETLQRRQYLLSGGRETPEEFAAIKELVSSAAPEVSMPPQPFYERSNRTV